MFFPYFCELCFSFKIYLLPENHNVGVLGQDAAMLMTFREARDEQLDLDRLHAKRQGQH